MSMSTMQVNNASGVKDNSELRAKAAELVGNTFYGTLLREFRETSEDGIFSGGFGGKAFQQQLDNVFVSEMSKQENNSLIDSVVRQLSRNPKNNTTSILSKINLNAGSNSTEIAVQAKPAVDITTM